MIRTLIEVTAENDYDHASDLWRELRDRGLDPAELVKAFRAKRKEDQF